MDKKNLRKPKKVPIVNLKKIDAATEPAKGAVAAQKTQKDKSKKIKEPPKRVLIVRVERLDLVKALKEWREKIARARLEMARSTQRRSQRLLMKSNLMNTATVAPKAKNANADFPADLILHVQINPEKRIYQCKICQVQFGRKFTLTRHIRTKHSGKKPYICEICQNCFTRLEYLQRHNRTHAAKKH